jgi:hypothetical protein
MDIDVFFCRGGEGLDPPDWLVELRKHMSILCCKRWQQEEGIRLHTVSPTMLDNLGYTAPFQKARRQYAEDHSKSDIYVVADDDCLIGPDPMVGMAVEIMESNPNVGILSLSERTGPPMVRANVPLAELYQTDDLIESHAVGGVRFCRKGVVTDWPPHDPENPYQYDSIHGPAVKKAGYVSAYAKALQMNHIGAGYSITWKGASWRFWEEHK